MLAFIPSIALSLPVALPLVAAAVPQDPTPMVKDLIHIEVNHPSEIARLQTLLNDIDDHHAQGEHQDVVAYATDEEQAQLDSAGFSYRVETEDLAAWYERRALADPGMRSARGTMGGFRTLAEIEQELDRLATTYPHLVSVKQSIGTSIQGRDLWMVRISDNPTVHELGEPTAWFDALHHAREPMSAESLLLFMDDLCQNYMVDDDITRILDTRNLLFIPCVNPDGYEYNRQTNPNGGGMWRKNRRSNSGGSKGVDLNRNYDWAWGSQWGGSSGSGSSETYRGTAPFSEPETAALRDALVLAPPGVAQSVHTYSNLWLFPWSYDTIFAPDDAQLRDYARSMTASNGYAYGTSWEVLYVANGVADDYYYGQHGSMAFTPEIGSSSDGFWPSPSRIPALYQDVRPAYLMTCMWSGGWADLGELIWTEHTGNGDAFLDPGETWNLALTITNQGMEGLTVLVEPSENSSDVHLVGGPAQVQVPAWSTGQSPTWTIEILPQAAVGALVDLAIDLTWDGMLSSADASFLIGRPRTLLHDDMEKDDFGWVVSDNTHYSWERAVPQRTQNSGQTVQPGNDNPDGTGTLCWVTGAAAGSSAGTNDVDGTTWLTSPIFSLDGFMEAELSYSRWFANLPGSAMDDRLLAQISGDGGSTWITLEEPANDNQWRQATFALSDVVSLTNAMQIRFRAEDDPNNDLTEACIDDVMVQVWTDLPSLGFWGKPALLETCSFFIDGVPHAPWTLGWSFQTQTGGSLPGTDGMLYLQSPQIYDSGSFAGDGIARIDLVVPNLPNLIGRTVHFQAVVDYGGPHAALSNLQSVVIQ